MVQYIKSAMSRRAKGASCKGVTVRSILHAGQKSREISERRHWDPCLCFRPRALLFLSLTSTLRAVSAPEEKKVVASFGPLVSLPSLRTSSGIPSERSLLRPSPSASALQPSLLPFTSCQSSEFQVATSMQLPSKRYLRRVTQKWETKRA